MFLFLILASLACTLAWVAQKLHDRLKGLPPGPFRFPLIGCMPQVLMADANLPFVAFQKLSKAYKSGIIYLQLGVVKAVAINGYEANKAIMCSDDWIGRNDEKWMLDRLFGKQIGIIHGDIEHWRESRRFCVRTLRDYGFGVKKKMEVHMSEQAAEFCEALKERIGHKSGIVKIKQLFDLPVLNSTWTMITGAPFERNDPRLPELFVLLEEFFQSCSLGAGLVTAYPFLVDWAPKLVKFDQQHRTHLKFHAFFRELIAEIRDIGAYKEHPSSFAEIFIQKIEEVQKTDPGNTVYSDENLISIFYDLFLGSTETTSNTLNMSVVYLLHYPKIQQRVVQEIYEVMGKNRFATLADKEKMPYTSATVLELLRLTVVLPIGPRKLHKDATFGSYKIPKGTTVFPNFWSVSMDDTIWPDPEVFRPERFLDGNGRVINEDKIMTFAMGKRNCLGENVARSTFFVILTGLLQHFELQLNPNEPKPTLRPELGITLMPKPFSFVLKVRD